MDIGCHRMTRFWEVLVTISISGKYSTEKTNELLELWLAVTMTSTVSFIVALMI